MALKLNPKKLLARSAVVRRIYNGPPPPELGSFDAIYESNLWGHGSGHGSLPSVTRDYRRFLERFIRDHEVESVVDYGCGDWQFSRLIDWGGVDYLGIDVVEKVVSKNEARYASDRIRFQLGAGDVSGDLLISKHVLQHLSNDAVRGFLDAIVPKFRYALITNDVIPAHTLNRDIVDGDYRALDIRLPPFCVEAQEVMRIGRSRPTFALRRQIRPLPPWEAVVLLIESRSTKL